MCRHILSAFSCRYTLVALALLSTACTGESSSAPDGRRQTVVPTVESTVVTRPVEQAAGTIEVWVLVEDGLAPNRRCNELVERIVPLSLAGTSEFERARCSIGMNEFLHLTLRADESGIAYLESVQLPILVDVDSQSSGRNCLDARSMFLPPEGDPERSRTAACELEAGLLSDADETIRVWIPLPAGGELPPDPRCHDLLPLLGESSEPPHDRYVLCRLTASRSS